MMPFLVTADPTIAFVDAVRARLTSDSVLAALVTGVYGHLSEAARVAYPYIVLGRRSSNGDGGAMGLRGGVVSLQIDVFSQAKGPYEASRIASLILARLERYPLAPSSFSLIGGSLILEFAEVFDEPDEDKPGARIYHAVQRWTAIVEELS